MVYSFGDVLADRHTDDRIVADLLDHTLAI